MAKSPYAKGVDQIQARVTELQLYEDRGPSHDPLVVTAAEMGDLVGIRWRPGSASAPAGATGWPEVLVVGEQG